jgi:hypothetical protein
MSNSKLYLGKLDTRAVKNLEGKAFKGKKGDYLDVSIWVNEEPDQFGNSVSISFGKDTEKVYLGNAKVYDKAPF